MFSAEKRRFLVKHLGEERVRKLEQAPPRRRRPGKASSKGGSATTAASSGTDCRDKQLRGSGLDSES